MQRLLGLIVTFLFATALHAQGMPVVPYAANFAQTNMNNQVWVGIGNNANRQKGTQKQSSSQSQAAAPSLNFRVDRARRRANLNLILTNWAKIDPANANAAKGQFEGMDLFESIQTQISPYGLRVDNVADAFTVYWVSAWEASQGIVGAQESRARAQAVKAQTADALAASPDFARLTDRQKQEIAEGMLFETVLIGAAIEQAAKNPAQLREVSQAVKKGAIAIGFDLDKMTLTEDGFVPAKPRKKADASDAAGDDATALASADTGDAEQSTPNYALFAGAAGAGLGAAFLIGKAMGKKG